MERKAAATESAILISTYWRGKQQHNTRQWLKAALGRRPHKRALTPNVPSRMMMSVAGLLTKKGERPLGDNKTVKGQARVNHQDRAAMFRDRCTCVLCAPQVEEREAYGPGEDGEGDHEGHHAGLEHLTSHPSCCRRRQSP